MTSQEVSEQEILVALKRLDARPQVTEQEWSKDVVALETLAQAYRQSQKKVKELESKRAGEAYPPGWTHTVIHRNSETGEIHSDGEHSLKDYILNLEQQVKDLQAIAQKCLDPNYMKDLSKDEILMEVVKRLKEAKQQVKELEGELDATYKRYKNRVEAVKDLQALMVEKDVALQNLYDHGGDCDRCDREECKKVHAEAEKVLSLTPERARKIQEAEQAVIEAARVYRVAVERQSGDVHDGLTKAHQMIDGSENLRKALSSLDAVKEGR